MTQPARSREEYDIKIKNAEAAGDKGAVIELTRRRDEKFPVHVSPTGETGQLPVGGGPQPVPGAPEGPPVQWGMVDEAGEQFTMGLGPKIVAAGMAGVKAVGGDNFSDAYSNYRSRQTAAQEQYRAEHPNAAQAGQAIGFAGSIGPFRNVSGRLLPSALTGAGVGGATGFAEDTEGEGGIVERLVGAAKGAAVGGTIGAAIPLAARGAGWTWNTVRRALQEGTGIQQRSVEKIVAELQHQGLTPQQAGQAAQRLGPEGMLADVSPGMQQMTAATGAVEPGAATTITRNLRDRRLAAPERTRGYLDRAMGPARDPYTVQQTTRGALDAIGPEYRTAIANAPQLPTSLDDLIAEGLTFPMADMSLASRRELAPYFDQIDDALRADTPSMVASRLHDIRMRLDRQLQGSALTNADRASRGALQNVRNVVDDVLKNRVPGFREADAQYAPINRQQEAFEQGRTDVMRAGPSTMTPAELRHHYRQSTPEVNQMRTQGMRAELERQTQNERQNAALTVDRTLNRDFNAEKLGTQIGPTRADRLANELDREGTFLETSNMAEAGRGSRTAPLAETARRVWGTDAGRGVVGDMAVAGGTAFGTTGSLTAGAATAGAVATRRLVEGAADRLSRPAAEVIRQTAENLTLNGGRRNALVRQLIDEAGQIPVREQSRQRIEGLVRALLMRETAPAGEAASQYGGQR